MVRWIDECLECGARDSDLSNKGIRYQSFVAFLVNHAPQPCRQNYVVGGVADYRAIFTRALGLNTMFLEPPDRSTLSAEFIRSYYRYAEQIFTGRQNQVSRAAIESLGFRFDIFASGEYSRMLDREWPEQEVSANK